MQPAPKSFSTNSTIKDPADWRFERIADVMLELQKLGISPVVFFELFCSSGKANALFPNNCYTIDDDSFTKLWIDKAFYGNPVYNADFIYKTLEKSGFETSIWPTAQSVNERNLLFVSSLKSYPKNKAYLNLDAINFDDAQILKDEYPAFE